MRGLSWWTIPLNVDGTRNCSLWNYVWSQAGNLIFTVSKTALQITIAIKEAAAADDPLKFLYDESGGAVATVFAVFFVPVASLMFILAGIWAGINALRRKGIRAALGAAAVAAGIIALAGFAYTATAGGSQRVPQPSRERSTPRSPRSTPSPPTPCSTSSPQDSGACILPDGPADAIRGQRLTSCVLADALAYRPWAIGQFGGAGAGPDPVARGLDSCHPGRETAPSRSRRSGRRRRCPATWQPWGTARTCGPTSSPSTAECRSVSTLSGQNGYLKCAAGATAAFTDSPAWMLIKSRRRGER